MKSKITKGIHELPELRNCRRVFRDRAHAGEVLAKMLKPYRQETAIVFGIPAGGVPVATVLARRLKIPFDIAVVSKITLPWNTEAGYGAVAFDGTVKLNNALVSRIGLTEKEIEEGLAKTTTKISRRVEKLRGGRPFPNLSKRWVILVDDGLASGFTMRVAVEALNNSGAEHITVAVPTAHAESMQPIFAETESIFCPNIRSGLQYAVADAYENWYDIDEARLKKILETFSEENG